MVFYSSAAPVVTLPGAAHPIGARLSHKYPANPHLPSLLIHLPTTHTHTHSTTMQPPTLQITEKEKLREYQEHQRIYVNALVDITVQAIASIWPNAIRTPSSGTSHRPIANLSTFLHHILKHSRTTHSTLQLAIFYLFRVRPRVHARHETDDVYMACGRRMFLASLICAHKFLHDKTYKNSAWSKVSGLTVHEINHAEKVMLQLLEYRLYVKKDTYDQWMDMLQNHLKMQPMPTFRCAELPEEKPAAVRTCLYLGMATPVEANASVCIVKPTIQLPSVASLGLLSPPECIIGQKRKHTSFPLATAAPAAPAAEHRVTKRRL